MRTDIHRYPEVANGKEKKNANLFLEVNDTPDLISDGSAVPLMPTSRQGHPTGVIIGVGNVLNKHSCEEVRAWQWCWEITTSQDMVKFITLSNAQRWFSDKNPTQGMFSFTQNVQMTRSRTPRARSKPTCERFAQAGNPSF